MVYRIYVEKKPGFDVEAEGLKNELVSLLGVSGLTGLRLLNRYDVEGIDEALFQQCASTVFSEPPVDDTYDALPQFEGVSFAVEYLPGQFDQRADSAAECIQLISQGERPLVRSARVYLLQGSLTEAQVEEIKKYVINPVEAREASLEKKDTLKMEYPIPSSVAVLDGFNELDEEGLKKFIEEKGLAMDLGDIRFCQDYFRGEHRDPTITEIRMIDTYWSDHCRHTTFGTILDDVQIDDAVVQEAFDRYMAMREDLGRTKKPRCMMDLATIGAKELKKQGILKNLDESEEINACTVKIKCDVNGKDEDWLFLFKNETHNHPTEIEPFGGAATCIGGAIRDPLSGRSYVYQAMRVTGAGDPLKPVSETLPGKLPQRKLVTTAAAGYSSYGNQIGLATGQVDEIYHPGYVAKRMEIGAVVGATPASHVRRECPAPGDVIVLLGGRTGRDGIGGATGSSKAHNLGSLDHCGAEVHPTFLYESIWCLVGFAVLASFYKKRRFNGQIFLCYIIWYGLGRAWIEGLRTDSLLIGNTGLRASQLVAIGSVIVAAALMAIGLRNAKGKQLMVPLAVKDLKKQAEAGDRFTPDTLPVGAPHAEFVKATDAMNARLDALDLSEVEIEEIETPKE